TSWQPGRGRPRSPPAQFRREISMKPHPTIHRLSAARRGPDRSRTGRGKRPHRRSRRHHGSERSAMSKRHITVAALLAAAGLAPAAARATYPGRNGQIVFPMGGGSVELYTVSPDGSGLKQLTNAKGFNGCPAFSLDGKTIAFCSNRTGSYQIWAMSADGSKQRQVTRFAYPSLFPAFSPDTRRIYFNADDGGPAGEDVFVVPAAGGKPTRLTGSPGDDEYPAVSPDGKTIA